jgi:hypothetical protein
MAGCWAGSVPAIHQSHSRLSRLLSTCRDRPCLTFRDRPCLGCFGYVNAFFQAAAKSFSPVWTIIAKWLPHPGKHQHHHYCRRDAADQECLVLTDIEEIPGQSSQEPPQKTEAPSVVKATTTYCLNRSMPCPVSFTCHAGLDFLDFRRNAVALGVVGGVPAIHQSHSRLSRRLSTCRDRPCLVPYVHALLWFLISNKRSAVR